MARLTGKWVASWYEKSCSRIPLFIALASYPTAKACMKKISYAFCRLIIEWHVALLQTTTAVVINISGIIRPVIDSPEYQLSIQHLISRSHSKDSKLSCRNPPGSRCECACLRLSIKALRPPDTKFHLRRRDGTPCSDDGWVGEVGTPCSVGTPCANSNLHPTGALRVPS